MKEMKKAQIETYLMMARNKEKGICAGNKGKGICRGGKESIFLKEEGTKDDTVMFVDFKRQESDSNFQRDAVPY